MEDMYILLDVSRILWCFIGHCLFCWYWLNGWPSLFKLSFHNIIQFNKAWYQSNGDQLSIHFYNFNNKPIHVCVNIIEKSQDRWILLVFPAKIAVWLILENDWISNVTMEDMYILLDVSRILWCFMWDLKNIFMAQMATNLAFIFITLTTNLYMYV
jgi:hypothetical protein